MFMNKDQMLLKGRSTNPQAKHDEFQAKNPTAFYDMGSNPETTWWPGYSQQPSRFGDVLGWWKEKRGWKDMIEGEREKAEEEDGK